MRLSINTSNTACTIAEQDFKPLYSDYETKKLRTNDDGQILVMVRVLLDQPDDMEIVYVTVPRDSIPDNLKKKDAVKLTNLVAAPTINKNGVLAIYWDAEGIEFADVKATSSSSGAKEKAAA